LIKRLAAGVGAVCELELDWTSLCRPSSEDFSRRFADQSVFS
jgi:hypothetical protein